MGRGPAPAEGCGLPHTANERRTHDTRLSPGQTVLPTQANSSQVHNFDGVGYRLATHLAWVGLNLIKLKFSPNSSQLFHRLATSANSSQLSPSCFVIVMWLRGRMQTIWMVYLRAGLTWRYRLANRRCKFWFCNLARVGLSCECRLARALKPKASTFMAWKRGDGNWPLPKRAGSWVRITTAMALGIVWRWDSINQSSKKKMPRQYNCCAPGCTNSHNCSVAAFLLAIFACPVSPNDPKRLCVADPDPGSHSFYRTRTWERGYRALSLRRLKPA